MRSGAGDAICVRDYANNKFLTEKCLLREDVLGTHTGSSASGVCVRVLPAPRVARFSLAGLGTRLSARVNSTQARVTF